MQTFKDIAQQALFAAMQPGQISQHIHEQASDLQAFDRAAQQATNARYWRNVKTRPGAAISPGRAEAIARECERRVREIALQSEIILQRRVEAAQADRAMLGIMLGVAS